MLASRPPARRRVPIVISEARDRTSRMSLEEAVSLAQRENVMVYAAGFSPLTTPFTARPQDYHQGAFDLITVFREIRQMGKKNAASALARYTGGEYLRFTRWHALESVITRIGEDLHSQYWVSFTVPEDDEPRFHPIAVVIRGRPDLIVRTRPGYWSVR